MIDNIEKCFEAAVMKKAALVLRTHKHTVFADEYSGEIRSLVGMIRRPIRLETVYTDVGRFVQIPSRLRPERFDMAIVAFGFSAEEFVPTLGGGRIEVLPRLWSRSRNSKLIELECREFPGDQVLIRINMRQVSQVVRLGNWELGCVVQSRIKEPAFAVKLESLASVHGPLRITLATFSRKSLFPTESNWRVTYSNASDQYEGVQVWGES